MAEKKTRFQLTSGQIGNNPVWLFNDKPISLEINEDLQAIQDRYARLIALARRLYAAWEDGKEWNDGETYTLFDEMGHELESFDG